MITKKIRGSDLEELLDKLEKELDFSKLRKEFQNLMMRQKQKYSINTMLEEYEISFTLSLKKIKK